MAFSGKAVGDERADYKAVMGVVLDGDGRVLLGHKAGVAIFDDEGAAAGAVASVEPTTFFLDEKNRVIVARGGSLIADRAEALSLAVPSPEGRPRPLEEIPAALPTSRGDRLVADGKAKIVIRVTADGKYRRPVCVAARDAHGDERTGRRGACSTEQPSRSTSPIATARCSARLPREGTGYELTDPVDMAYDSLGHLYVLDRASTVLVFGPKNKFVASVTIPEKNPGAFARAAAFGLDPAGRLYIFDERAKRIQVYQ